MNKGVLKIKDWTKTNEIKAKCPFCKGVNSYTKEVWDAICDKGATTEWDCKHCDYPMIINNKTFKVAPYKEDRNYKSPYDDY